MSRGANTIRQCEHCGQIGRQTRQLPFPFYSLREVVCVNPRCKSVRTTLELFLGPPVGRGQKVGQAQAFLNDLAEGTIAEAQQRVEGLNERFAELVRSGAVTRANAVRTCPSCAEPGQALYASNHGPFVMHCYVCSDKECGQRWMTGEFAMARRAQPAVNLTECIERLREATAQIVSERQERERTRRVTTQAIHQERALLIKEITSQRTIVRLTDDEVRATCRDLLAKGLRPTLEDLRAELAKRHSGRVGWRKQVESIWQEELARS